MNPVRATASRRLEGLDALRGLAAVSVMAYHYTSWYSWQMGGHPEPGVSLAFPYGNYGVELFFIISGFVIFMTLERSSSAAGFLVSRFARLWPAFLASMVVTILSGAILGGFGPPFDIARIAANLTMAPELLNAQALDGSYWSLQYELAFYFLGGFVWFVLRPRDPELSCAVWLLASLALRFASFGRVELIQLAAAPFSQLFVIGIMLYRFHAGRATASTWAVMTLAFAMTLFGPHAAVNQLPVPWYSCMIACFAALVWLATTPRVRLPLIAPLLFLGRISYPLSLLSGVFRTNRSEVSDL